MSHHRTHKTIFGLVAVVGFLALSTFQPAGAADVESGTIYIGGTPSDPTFTFPLGQSQPEGPCEPEANSVDPFEFDEGPGDPGTWEASGGFLGIGELLGDWIKLEYDLSTFSGQSWPMLDPDVTQLTGGGTLTVRFYGISWDPEAEPPRPCIKDELFCTLNVTGNLIVSSHHDAAAQQLYVDANSTAPHIQIGFFECDFMIWLALNGQPAYVRNLMIQLP